MKKRLAWILVLLMMIPLAAQGLEYWNEGTEVLGSIEAYVESLTDEQSPAYLPPEKRIAVFDSDGTLPIRKG